MNRISFLNRGYAFKGLLAVSTAAFELVIRFFPIREHLGFNTLATPNTVSLERIRKVF